MNALKRLRIAVTNHSNRSPVVIAPAPSPFELWAQDNGYDIAPAVLPMQTVTLRQRLKHGMAAWRTLRGVFQMATTTKREMCPAGF